jgi:hypothetical protein
MTSNPATHHCHALITVGEYFFCMRQLSANHSLLLEAAPKRILDALTTSETPALAMKSLRDEGVIEAAFPELADLWKDRGQQDPRWHPEGDTWEHTMLVLDALDPNASRTLRIAALFHDVGKPLTFKQWPSGGISNHGHDNVGANLFFSTIGPRLGLTPEETASVAKLIENHMLMQSVHDRTKVSVETLEMLLSLREIDDLIELHHADMLGRGIPLEERLNQSNRDYMTERVARVRGQGDQPDMSLLRAPVVDAILITQTLQRDFIQPLQPGEQLPNLVHVGRLEAERLTGEGGDLVRFLELAHRIPPERLAIIHILDDHDPILDREHLEQFQPHCLSGSEGAKLIEPIDKLAQERPNTFFVRASDLADLKGKDLQRTLREILAGRGINEVRIGVVGVWTNAKVSFLLYDLHSQEGARNLATCSALTASNSLSRHFDALDHLHGILGVNVQHSSACFLDWLVPGHTEGGTFPAGPSNFIFTKQPRIPNAWNEADLRERDGLLTQIGGERLLQLTPLGGGFSPSQVFIARGSHGSSIIKVGAVGEIAHERFGYQRVGRVLRDNVPQVMGFREGRRLGAMEIELLRGDERVRFDTFQNLSQKDFSPEADLILHEALRSVLTQGIGTLYRTGEKDNADLLRMYGFKDRQGRVLHAEHVIESAQRIADVNGFTTVDDLLGEARSLYTSMSPAEFYRNVLPSLSVYREVYASIVHADLNLMNILLSYDAENRQLQNSWVIDFARAARMPVLTDIAKIENDLSYIVCPISTQEEFQRALRFQALRLSARSLDEDVISTITPEPPQEARYLSLIRTLRKIAAKIDPRGPDAMEAYRVALLRYSAHTLSFSEPNPLQLRLALHGTAQLCRAIAG